MCIIFTTQLKMTLTINQPVFETGDDQGGVLLVEISISDCEAAAEETLTVKQHLRMTLTMMMLP